MYSVTLITVCDNGDMIHHHGSIHKFETLELAFHGTPGAYMILANPEVPTEWVFLPQSESMDPPKKAWRVCPDDNLDNELSAMMKRCGIPKEAL